jgi:esterase/lipase superfamily enzyme
LARDTCASKCPLWQTAVFFLVFSGALAISGPKALAQQDKVLAVGPQSIVRSTLFHLGRGDSVVVTGTVNAQPFVVDLFVYDKEKTLVAKDNEDSANQSFEWQPSIEGEYYLLARNLGSGSGSIKIAVRQSKSFSPPKTAQYVEMRVFFATDRTATAQRPPQAVFGSEPDTQGLMHFGECIVTIPRDHRMGELEGPSIYRLEFNQDPEKHIVLQTVNEEGPPEFWARIARRTANSQKQEVFVFIHGFNTTFEDASRRTAQMAYDLGFDGPAIFYSWPSQGRVGVTAYNMDGRNAELTVPHLNDFLSHLAKESGATTIHLIAHSMGNRPLTNALKYMSGQNASTNPAFNQVVLMAPDIDAALFRQMSQQIKPTAKRVTLYASSRDEALRLSSTYAGYPRAGQGGSQIVIVPGIDTIDASVVDTSILGFFHQYYADNSTILSDLFHLFKGEAAGTRFGLRPKTTSAGAYWVFLPTARSPVP